MVFLSGCSKNNSANDQINNINIISEKSNNSIFNKVQWEKVSEKNGITLFMQKNKNEKINSYKAEKILTSNQGEKIFKNLMDFDKYIKIFPRTMAYKKIKDISKDKYLLYCQANFKPFQNRDYYIVLEYSAAGKNNAKEWIIEWYPTASSLGKFPEAKGFVRVNYIYGRWKIIEANDKVKISVEYFNNYNLPVSKTLSVPFEKSSTIEALNQILKYSNQ
jgi:hypothetical protein